MIGVIWTGTLGLVGFLWITLIHMPIVILKKSNGIEYARKVLRRFSRMILKVLWSEVEVIYKDKEAFDIIGKKDGVVVVGNHQSNMDIPVLTGHFPLELGFVAKEEMAKWPLYSVWMRKSNCVFLNRTNPREGIKSIREAVKVIKAGYPTVIFPEGARSLDGEIKAFKKGSFRLAVDTDGVIVPVTIKGTYDIQRRGSLRIKLGKKVKMIIDKPIYLKELSKEEKKTLDVKVKMIIQENYGRY